MVTIASRAVNKVLFTERDELSSFLEVLSFQWSCCTESPARTALTWETEEYMSTVIIIFEGQVRRNSIKPWISIIVPCVAGAGLGKFEDTRACAKGEMEALGGFLLSPSRVPLARSLKTNQKTSRRLPLPLVSSLRSRRLEVAGERENGRARGRHACLLLVRPFFLVPTTSKRLLRRLLVS